MTHNNIELNKQKEYEQIKKDYEWLAKSNLEMIYKYEEGLSKEEIERLISGADWKEKTGFKISEGWGTTIGTGSKGISYKHDRSAFGFTYKPIYLISLKKREIKMMKELANVALNQTIEEKTIDKWKEKFSQQEMEAFLTIKKEFESLKKQLESAELDAEVHLEALSKAEQWKFKQLAHKLISLNKVRNMTIDYNETLHNTKQKNMKEEIIHKSELLEENRKVIEEQEEKKRKLQSELENSLELLKDARKTIEEKELELYLANKPLPSLPKKRNKFQKLGTKIKTKFQQLIKKEECQKQELVARIEVSVK